MRFARQCPLFRIGKIMPMPCITTALICGKVWIEWSMGLCSSQTF